MTRGSQLLGITNSVPQSCIEKTYSFMYTQHDYIREIKSSISQTTLNEKPIDNFRFYLKGPKRGRKEIFADNLPGLPDNLRPSSRPGGGYWVALAVIRHPDMWSMWDLTSNHVWLKRIMASVSIYPSSQKLYIKVSSFKTVEYREFNHWLIATTLWQTL